MMLWPLLLSVFVQQPDPPVPPAPPAAPDEIEVEMVEVPSPFGGKKQHVIQLSGGKIAAALPVQGLASLELEMSQLYRQLRSSLVEVRFEFGSDEAVTRTVMVSGMVMDNYGLFVTPVVFSDQEREELKGNITVYRTDGRAFGAEFVDWNVDYKVSLLRAKELKGLAPRFGHGLWLEEGSVTIGVGHPFGLPNSMSFGFLTGRQRGINKASGLLQITNPVNVGDSGGVLADRHGQVVGMMLVSLADAARRAGDKLTLFVAEFGNDSVDGALQAQGIAFAIPVEVLFSIFSEHFPASTAVSRRIGVYVEEQIRVIEQPGQEPRHTWEVVVTGLMPQTPGESSGVLPGDVVLSLGGLPTPSLQGLGVAIHSAQVSTTIVVRRSGEKLELPLEFEL